ARRQADLAGDRRIPRLRRQAELVLGVLGGRVREEVLGAMLDSLVDREQHQGPVAGPVVEQEPAQPRALAGRERCEKRLLLGDRLDFHLLHYLRDWALRPVCPIRPGGLAWWV